MKWRGRWRSRQSHQGIAWRTMTHCENPQGKLPSPFAGTGTSPWCPGTASGGPTPAGRSRQYSEAIVLSISAGNHLGEVDSIMIEKLGKNARTSRGSGKKKTLRSSDLNHLTENCGCRRVRWPNESVRSLEWTRQMPESDEVYSIKCTGRLAPGDRIRFNAGSGSGGHGDAPLIEAVVEKIEIPGCPWRSQLRSGSRTPGASEIRRRPER